MNYKKINLDNWQRKEYFNHFLNTIPCTYSMTVKLDVTNIVNNKLQFYPAIIFFITQAVNQLEEFRTAYNTNKELVIYDKMIPNYTVFNKIDNTFYNLWTECNSNIFDFIKSYNVDIKKYENSKIMNPKSETPENTFPISMLPWVHFESFNLNLLKGYDYLLPIFTAGRYQYEFSKYIVPLSLQVHHSVCDGYHVGKFINILQEMIFDLSSNLRI